MTQSKRRVIVGWRQVPVQKIRTRAGRPAATPAAGAAQQPRADADEPDDVQPPEPTGRTK